MSSTTAPTSHSSKNAGKRMGIADTLGKLVRESDGDTIEVGEAIDLLSYRGFGPLLLVPSIITILPTGALPFVPAVCGLLIICFSLQVAAGRKRPWVPEKLRDLSLDKSKFEKSIESKKGFIQKIDKLLAPRLEWCVQEKSQRITGVIVSILAFIMITIGFIPFAPDVLALPILFFALGYMAQDGLLVLIGYVLSVVALVAMPFMFGMI
jgi:hypothetical protein